MQKARKLEQVWELMRVHGGLASTLSIEGSVEEGAITATMPITRAHIGAPGVAHGGSLMALLDSTLGSLALAHALESNRATSTVEMKVNFLRPAPEGERIVARASLQSAGKTLLVVTGTAEIESSGEAVAFAVGTFNLFPIDKLQKVDRG